jgi:hypothetical protein
MILDARLADTCRTSRPFTASAAVANLLDEIEIGASVDVDAFLAPDGSDLNKDRLAMIVHKLKGDRTFQVIAKYSNAGLATVRRIA